MLARSLLVAIAITFTGAAAAAATADSQACIGCHDFGEDSPVHPLLAGPHGDSERDGTPMAGAGCQACHGPSESHARSPIQIAPGVSFGPHWSSAIDEQDARCQDCHSEGAGRHWSDSHHQQAELACVTCHDVHTAKDTVLAVHGQAETCTVCHKAQQTGIHGMQTLLEDNPPCSSCHAPHDNSEPRTAMLANQSGGCATCHDLVAMADDPQVSAKANSYHKVMASQDNRTCLACHVGVAHPEPADVAPLEAQPRPSRDLSLFYPGPAHSEGLRQRHPGLQPLREGLRCQMCHRGQEASLAGTLFEGRVSPPARDMTLSFDRDGDQLVVELAWDTDGNDRDVSLMWADRRNEVFARAGCFAACHDDLPGMTRDRGQALGKYLAASRLQERGVGRPPLLLDDAELERLRAQGLHAELWRVSLGKSANVQTGSVLADIDWHAQSLVSGSATVSDGRWRVTLQRPLSSLPAGVDFAPGTELTLGIALHGEDNPGAMHWVSLPLTFATDGTSTDFRLR